MREEAQRSEAVSRDGGNTPAPKAATAQAPHLAIAFALPSQFRLLQVAVPPMLEEAIAGPIAAERPSRLIGFFPLSGEIAWSDGERSARGDWRCWNLWRQHPAVRHGLIGAGGKPADDSCNFCDPGDWLLVDRDRRRIHAGAPDACLEILQRQWCRGPGIAAGIVLTGQAKKLSAVLQECWHRAGEALSDALAGVMGGVVRGDAIVCRLQAWLDHYPVAVAREVETWKRQFRFN